MSTVQFIFLQALHFRFRWILTSELLLSPSPNQLLQVIQVLQCRSNLALRSPCKIRLEVQLLTSMDCPAPLPLIPILEISFSPDLPAPLQPLPASLETPSPSSPISMLFNTKSHRPA